MQQPFREPQTEEEARELERFLEEGAETSLEVLETFSPVTLPEALMEPAVVAFSLTREDLLGRVTGEESQLVLDVEVAGVTSSDDPPLLVFVNATPATQDQPAVEAGFVGALAFFVASDDAEHGTVRFRLNATDAVRNAGELPGPLTVTFVPALEGDAGAETQLRLASAQIQLVRSVVEGPGDLG